MKILAALGLAFLCLSTCGQTPKPIFTRDTWLNYMANSKKIAELEARMTSISIATIEKKGLVRLQGQAHKISGDQAHKAELEADKNWATKTEPLKKEIARLKLKQQYLENLYAMPVAAPVQPQPARKTKP